jgi:hypothetical protein
MLSVRMPFALLLTILLAALLPMPHFGLDAHAQAEKPILSVAPALPSDKMPEYGAIAFTPDGSFFSVWKLRSQTEAEEKARAECTALDRGTCEVVSFRGEVCAAIVSAQLAKQRKITYSGGGLIPGDAERLALKRCNADGRARGSCQLRTTVCGDGRLDSAARAP